MIVGAEKLDAAMDRLQKMYDRSRYGELRLALDELVEFRDAADRAYRGVAKEAADLLGPRAPGAAAMFDQAATEGLYGEASSA